MACSLRRDSDLTVPKDPILHTQVRYENRMLKDLLLQLQSDISECINPGLSALNNIHH